MMQTITFYNLIKETGKTYSVLQLAKVLASYNRRVLMIDLDPHAHLTALWTLTRPVLSWYETFLRGQAIIPRPVNSLLHLLPANHHVARAEFDLDATRLSALPPYLSEIFKDYDHVLIDCPPSMGVLSELGVGLADKVIVPIMTRDLYVQGLRRNIQELDRLNQLSQVPVPIISFFPQKLNDFPGAKERVEQVAGQLAEYLAQAVGPSLREDAPPEQPWINLGQADYHDLFMEVML